ncbi:glycosyltransferase family A protein [Caldivirga maquilingensis]|uniref:Glycosyl transferase family 2 n=1 Tax=Caldivirga maquilingensis (strain ATCC 700844 / DSM 13496 / JCM 10307 / IC-167) TaxID=397948 RepID=A8ME35_CALMQ|nr:glycosyltransferase family A protein [Caldivirga maquilingensis]ABW02041.1 hypothetical protein Cmaq_1214 [Caldivirga maquilingensis IC-167]
MSSVVLSIITRNGALKGDVFRLMLLSTLQIPYKAIILIDDSDNDKTLNVVKSFANENNKELLASRSNTHGGRATRAIGRQTAFDLFLRNFIEGMLIQLDDDVILMNGWWSAVTDSLSDERIGLYYGLTYDVNDLNSLSTSNVNIQAVLINALERGRTNDFAIRRDALSAIEGRFGAIPPELHLYEDAWIWRAIQCAGYGIVIGLIGAFQHDPVKLSGLGDINVDIKYLKLASRYGIVQSVNPLNDSLRLLAPLLRLPSMVAKYGLTRGVKETWFRILYRYAKIKGTLTFNCSKLNSRGLKIP